MYIFQFSVINSASKRDTTFRPLTKPLIHRAEFIGGGCFSRYLGSISPSFKAQQKSYNSNKSLWSFNRFRSSLGTFVLILILNWNLGGGCFIILPLSFPFVIFSSLIIHFGKPLVLIPIEKKIIINQSNTRLVMDRRYGFHFLIFSFLQKINNLGLHYGPTHVKQEGR